MSEQENGLECTVICWGIATLVGIAAIVMLYLLGDFDAMQALFTGGLIGVLLGVVLSLFVCRGQRAAADLNAEEKPAQRYKREAAEKMGQAPQAAPAPAAAAPTASAAPTGSAPAATPSTAAASASAPAFQMQPDAVLAGQKDLESRKGTWTYTSSNDPSPAAAETAAPAAPAASAAADAGDGEAPALYDSPSDGAADDLKLISGVGPKLEQTLNELGIWYFKQVAAWGPSDIAWVDQRLRFKGRIERDDWMSQAKILAEGGETEFSKKKKK